MCDTPIINKVAKSIVALRVIHTSKMLKRVFELKACDAEVEMGLKDKEDPWMPKESHYFLYFFIFFTQKQFDQNVPLIKPFDNLIRALSAHIFMNLPFGNKV